MSRGKAQLAQGAELGELAVDLPLPVSNLRWTASNLLLQMPRIALLGL